MDAKEFGAFIAKKRKEKNMTQRELADKLKVTDKAISRWENGHGYPDIESLEDLSTALGVSLLELMHASESDPLVSVEEASRAVSETIHMNIDDRNKERRITLVLLAVSLGLILLLSMFRHHLLVALIACAVGAGYILAAVMMLLQYRETKSRKMIFFTILLLLVPFTILILLMTTQITVH